MHIQKDPSASFILLCTRVDQLSMRRIFTLLSSHKIKPHSVSIPFKNSIGYPYYPIPAAPVVKHLSSDPSSFHWFLQQPGIAMLSLTLQNRSIHLLPCPKWAWYIDVPTVLQFVSIFSIWNGDQLNYPCIFQMQHRPILLHHPFGLFNHQEDRRTLFVQTQTCNNDHIPMKSLPSYASSAPPFPEASSVAQESVCALFRLCARVLLQCLETISHAPVDHPVRMNLAAIRPLIMSSA